MGAYDISLKLLGVGRADDACRICAKARGHTINKPVFAHKKIDQAARIQHALAIDGRKLYLCAMSGDGNELLDRNIGFSELNVGYLAWSRFDVRQTHSEFPLSNA